MLLLLLACHPHCVTIALSTLAIALFMIAHHLVAVAIAHIITV
jgi:hypothetical protein